jgi:hypothetical protein
VAAVTGVAAYLPDADGAFGELPPIRPGSVGLDLDE